MLPHKHAISQHITTHPDDQNNTNKDQPCFIYMAVFIQPFMLIYYNSNERYKWHSLAKKHSKSRESLWILKCRKNITEFLLLPDSKVCSCHYCEEDFKLSSQYSSMANDKIKIIPTPTSFTLMY